MKKVLYALLLLLPLSAQAQKRHEYTFDFTKPEALNPPVIFEEEDYVGAEYNLTNAVLKSADERILVHFGGRSGDGRGGVLVTGSSYGNGSFDHSLFIARGATMMVTSNGNGVELDSLIFSSNSVVGNLTFLSPSGIGIVDGRNESWYSNGALGVTQLEYINNGQVPEIRQFTVIYRSPMDVLEPIRVTPANQSKIHRIETIEIAYNQDVMIGGDAKFELTGPQGFNPVLMEAQVVDKQMVVLSLPEGVTIDETNEARRGTYILTIAQKSIIGDDEDGYYNKKTVYTFDVVEAFNKFEKDGVYPDDQVEQVTEIPNGIVIGFPTEVGKFSADEIKLVDRDGNNIRAMKAQWLDESEYIEDAPFFKQDKDIYQFVKFVFTGSKTAAVKASGIYHFTVPEGFIWNNKYDSAAEDEGISAGARFNPEFTIEYNVNGVVYPSDEILHKADSLLNFTGAGYPAAESPARVALQKLVEEGIGADTVFEEAMEAFYAETDIEMPSDGYYLLSAVPSEGDEVYVSYAAGKIGLTKDVEDAVHLLSKVNEDGTIVFATPDGKYLTQMMPTGTNVTNTLGKMSNLTFSRLVLKNDDSNDLYTPEQLFGLWSINGIIAIDDEGKDITAYTLVNLNDMTFGTSSLKNLHYFNTTQTNAFRLTETDEPIPAAIYTLDPPSGSAVETLYRIELSFTNIDEVELAENAKSLITLVGSSTLTYNPIQITAISGTKNKFQLSFEDVKAGEYTLIIPKGIFQWTFDSREAIIQEITANYTVKSGIDFCYDFLNFNEIFYYGIDFNEYFRDVDMNELILLMFRDRDWGVSNKQVIIQNVDETQVYGIGHLELLQDFSVPDVAELSGIHLVMDQPVKAGSMRPDEYEWRIPGATFGDANFAKWVEDPQSISKTECHVNYELYPHVTVDNDKANMHFSPRMTSAISSLSEVVLSFPYFDKVTIVGTNNLKAYSTFYGDEVDATLEPIDGSENSFRFVSTEPLVRTGSVEGQYKIVVPRYMFACTKGDITEHIPTYGPQEVIYYGNGADAVDSINVELQSNVIFDLTGRRVNNTSRSGIYIVNGRKVLVK